MVSGGGGRRRVREGDVDTFHSFLCGLWITAGLVHVVANATQQGEAADLERAVRHCRG